MIWNSTYPRRYSAAGRGAGEGNSVKDSMERVSRSSHSLVRLLPLLLCVVFSLSACQPNTSPVADPAPVSLQRHAYVWQAAALESWHDVASIEPVPAMDLWWFAGQVEVVKGKLQVRTFPLAASTGPAPLSGAVLRVRTPVIDWLETATEAAMREEFLAPLKSALTSVGPGSARLQLDFDCPTAKLAHYGRLLSTLRAALPEVELSITALPDWLPSEAFAALQSSIDFYVLQLHGLERPATITDATPIFDAPRASRYLESALALGAPFHVALPTYGHREWFREDGTFVGVSAEIPPALSSTEHRVRENLADPVELAHFVHSLQGSARSPLWGIFWFRLPAEDDALNWCADTFRHVVMGEKPPRTLSAALHPEEGGRCRITLHNSPDHHYRGRVELRLTHPGEGRFWAEGLRGFEVKQTKDSIVLLGVAPEPGNSVDVAWFRGENAEPVDAATLNLTLRSLQ